MTGTMGDPNLPLIVKMLTAGLAGSVAEVFQYL